MGEGEIIIKRGKNDRAYINTQQSNEVKDGLENKERDARAIDYE